MLSSGHWTPVPTRARLAAIAVALLGFGGGMATLAATLDSHESLVIRTPAGQPQAAEAAGVGTLGEAGGDPRVTLQQLPTSIISQLVADGESVWIAAGEAIEADGVHTGVYKVTPGTGETTRVAGFVGRPVAGALVGPDNVAFSAGRTVFIIAKDGTVRSVQTPAVVPAAGAETADEITGLAAMGGRLYAVISTAQVVIEINLTTLNATVAALPSSLAPPAHVVALPSENSLLLSTPFKVGSLGPATAKMDVNTHQLTAVDGGRPIDWFQAADGVLYATQSVPHGGVLSLGFAATEAVAMPSLIPWDGRFDRAAVVPGVGTWGAPSQAGSLFFQAASGRIVKMDLPVSHMPWSMPRGVQAPLDQTAIRSVDSLVTLADGTAVFASVSPGGRIGWAQVP